MVVAGAASYNSYNYQFVYAAANNSTFSPNGVSGSSGNPTAPMGSKILLTVTTKVSGGTNNPSDFTIRVTGTNPSPNSFPGSSSGTSVTLNPGRYEVTASGPAAYTTKYSLGCSGIASTGGVPIECTISPSISIPTPTNVPLAQASASKSINNQTANKEVTREMSASATIYPKGTSPVKLSWGLLSKHSSPGTSFDVSPEPHPEGNVVNWKISSKGIGPVEADVKYGVGTHAGPYGAVTFHIVFPENGDAECKAFVETANTLFPLGDLKIEGPGCRIDQQDKFQHQARASFGLEAWPRQGIKTGTDIVVTAQHPGPTIDVLRRVDEVTNGLFNPRPLSEMRDWSHGQLGNKWGVVTETGQPVNAFVTYSVTHGPQDFGMIRFHTVNPSPSNGPKCDASSDNPEGVKVTCETTYDPGRQLGSVHFVFSVDPGHPKPGPKPPGPGEGTLQVFLADRSNCHILPCQGAGNAWVALEEKGHKVAQMMFNPFEQHPSYRINLPAGKQFSLEAGATLFGIVIPWPSATPPWKEVWTYQKSIIQDPPNSNKQCGTVESWPKLSKCEFTMIPNKPDQPFAVQLQINTYYKCGILTC